MPVPGQRATLRFDADESFVLPALSQLTAVAGWDHADGATSSEGEVARHRLEAVYFDTPDLQLAAAGVTLRRRTGGGDSGWHLRSPAGAEVSLPPGRVPPGRTPRTVPEHMQDRKSVV